MHYECLEATIVDGFVEASTWSNWPFYFTSHFYNTIADFKSAKVS
jgi:hypothetical protein